MLFARYDLDDDLRHLEHAQHGVRVVVALLHDAIDQRDLLIERSGQPEDDRALHLRLDDVGVDHGAALDHAIHALDLDPVVHEGDVDDLRDLGVEREVPREATRDAMCRWRPPLR